MIKHGGKNMAEDLSEDEWATDISFNDLACYIWDMNDDCGIPEVRDILHKHIEYDEKF